MAATEAHLAAYNQVDVALDTFPYNGTTTTCEALWMGVPVVSLIGNSHAARVGLSLLSAIGHAEWATENEENYIEKAVALAQDRSSGSIYAIPSGRKSPPVSSATQQSKLTILKMRFVKSGRIGAPEMRNSGMSA